MRCFKPAVPVSRILLVCFLPLLLSAVLTGCGKEDEPSPTPAAPAAGTVVEPSRAPVYKPAPQTAVPAATPAGEPDFASMNRELRRWILRNQRPPKDFEEFAASSGVQFPPPPAGKRYAIDKTMHVVLVKR